MNIKQYRLNINGKEVLGLPGQTILEVAVENDIYIPTLCYDERVKLYGSCGMCVCEVEGNPKLVKACAVEIQPNMVIHTNTKRVTESRKTNLELMLSNHRGDCRPPCVLACPAQTDCQGYVGLIANGEYKEALKLVKDKIPLPASLGRVCPHPCEDKCRRGLVDEPVSIQMLKRFVADHDLMQHDENIFVSDTEKPTGKSVAIIGGGPMGLSAAYFLRQKGHEVTIYEGMPKAGGMLRYGIPEYRLPKEVVDAEIDTIVSMGVEIVPNTRIGRDIPFETIREDHDAVLLGIGAWVSTGVGCKGEDTRGVIGGIDFLRRVVRNEAMDIGKKVAIVGGGNTAMDACRTAVRLGAEKVYNVYRRTKEEMPADMMEITEAEEEGVIFKNLTNPMEIKAGKDGRVNKMKLQIMELGEPDESGRRRPIPVKGKSETIDVDTVILAIGQAVDSSLVKDIDKTRKGGIAYDADTYMTSIEGVFAGGDCGNDKISIAVEAIADAKKVSAVMDSYLKGEKIKYEQPYLVTRDDITEKTFEDRERMCRPDYEELAPEDRKDNFSEVIPMGYDEEAAELEASRCMECGCHDYFECELIALAKQYNVDPERLMGDTTMIEYEDNHPFIVRDPNKCIVCGLCVRACDQLMGIEALGLVNRGFDTVVKPNMEKPLALSGCISCGQCVSLCPCGALQERQSITKEVPLKTDYVETTCAYCSVGCTLDLEYKGDLLIKANPDMDGFVNDGLACGMGKFGFDCSILEGKLEEPMIKGREGFRITDYHEALVMIAKKAEAAATRYGKDAVAVSISDRYTNEEAYAFKKLADAMGARKLCFNSKKSGLKPVLGFDASPNTIDEICSTDLVIAIGFNTADVPVIQLKMKRAAQNGAKVVLVNPRGSEQHFDFADKIWYTKNDVSVLKEIAKALIEKGKKPEGVKGFDNFKKSLDEVKISRNAQEIADMYAGAKKAMIVFEQNFVSEETATLIADIALLSGHIGKPRDGILQVKAKNNSQGLIDMGIDRGAEAMKDVKALLCFGEDPDPKYLDGLEFLMVSDTHTTRTVERADVVIPGTGFASTDGTYTNTERRMMPVVPAIDEGIVLSNWEIAAELASIYECDFGFEDTDDISDEMDTLIAPYRYGSVGEVLDGVLEPVTPELVPVGKAKFISPMECTDNLMNMIAERLPAVVSATE